MPIYNINIKILREKLTKRQFTLFSLISRKHILRLEKVNCGIEKYMIYKVFRVPNCNNNYIRQHNKEFVLFTIFDDITKIEKLQLQKDGTRKWNCEYPEISIIRRNFSHTKFE